MLCIVSAQFQTARLGSSGSSVCWRMCQRRWGMFQQRQRETPTTNMVCPPPLPPSMYVPCVCQFQKKGRPGHFHSCFLVTFCWSYLWHTQTIPLRSRFKAKTKWVSQAQFVKKNGALNLLQKNIQNLAVKFTVAVRSASPDSSCYETPPPRVAWGIIGQRYIYSYQNTLWYLPPIVLPKKWKKSSDSLLSVKGRTWPTLRPTWPNQPPDSAFSHQS